MKRNTRIALASAGAFLVILFGILPGLLGGPIESAFRAQFEGPRVSPLFQPRILEYDRGWFSSHATIAVDIRPIKAALMNARHGRRNMMNLGDEVELDIDLMHGPVVRTGGRLYWGLAGTSHTFDPVEAMSLTDKLSPELVAAQFVLPQVGLYTSIVIGFDGTARISQDIPALEVTVPLEESPVDIDWDGYTLKAIYDPEQATLDYHAEIPHFGLQVTEKHAAIDMSGFSVSGNMVGKRDYLWTGDSQMRLDHLTVDVPDANGEVVNLQNLSVDAGLGWQDEALLRYGGAFEIGTLKVNGGNESAIDINDARLELDLRNLSASALEGYYALITEAVLTGEADHEPNAALADAGLAVAREFIAAGVQFNIPEFRVTLPQGKLAYHHELAFDPEMSLDLGQPQDERVLRYVNYTGDVRMDEGVAKLIARSHLRDQLGERADALDEEQLDIGILNTLTQFQSMGYIEKEDGTYHAGVTLKDGTLNLNDVQVWQVPAEPQ